MKKQTEEERETEWQKWEAAIDCYGIISDDTTAVLGNLTPEMQEALSPRQRDMRYARTPEGAAEAERIRIHANASAEFERMKQEAIDKVRLEALQEALQEAREGV